MEHLMVGTIAHTSNFTSSSQGNPLRSLHEHIKVGKTDYFSDTSTWAQYGNMRESQCFTRVEDWKCVQREIFTEINSYSYMPGGTKGLRNRARVLGPVGPDKVAAPGQVNPALKEKRVLKRTCLCTWNALIFGMSVKTGGKEGYNTTSQSFCQ